MCGNRVEELETRVQELEASVEGLTDELIECKVRIRELENTVDEQNGFSDPAPSATERAEEPAGAEPTTEEPGEAETDGETDIIAPEPDTSNTEAPNVADNTTADPESESDEDSGSDIIVA